MILWTIIQRITVPEYKMDLKITISRSYSRKINLGNYETADFWASYSQEIPADSSSDLKELTSNLLFTNAKLDVQNAVNKELNKFGDVDPETRKELERTDWKLQGLYDRVRKNEPILLSDWESLTESQQKFLHQAQLMKAQQDRLDQKDAKMSDTLRGVSPQTGSKQEDK
jgi:hypothetical protein